MEGMREADGGGVSGQALIIRSRVLSILSSCLSKSSIATFFFFLFYLYAKDKHHFLPGPTRLVICRAACLVIRLFLFRDRAAYIRKNLPQELSIIYVDLR